MDALKKVAWWLLIVGGINWLLVGLGGFFGGDWNIVHMIFGSMPAVESIVYVLVGLSAVYCIFGCKDHKMAAQGGTAM